MASRDLSVQDSTSQTAQSFNFGEIHAVQERFQSLLKQRLLLEYENNPPLFPWESEVSEYPAEVSDAVGAECVPAVKIPALWDAHVSALKVPSLLPSYVLAVLFERCQELARSSSKQGVRLVRAVETLFPGQGDILEPIADMVLVPAYRSDSATQAAVTQELVNVAGDYDSAKPEQQIALSMLAAQEILSALTLTLSADSPHETRDWVTPSGVLKLSAIYDPTQIQGQLSVVAVLPEAGEIRLWNGEMEKRALRSQPGTLDLAWSLPSSGSSCFLEVSLGSTAGNEVAPLNFAIQLSEDQ
ncbi:MAG: hypothetical protein AAFR12_18015 [Cyanobacteria bacterium J06626_6]